MPLSLSVQKRECGIFGPGMVKNSNAPREENWPAHWTVQIFSSRGAALIYNPEC